MIDHTTKQRDYVSNKMIDRDQSQFLKVASIKSIKTKNDRVEGESRQKFPHLSGGDPVPAPRQIPSTVGVPLLDSVKKNCQKEDVVSCLMELLLVVNVHKGLIKSIIVRCEARKCSLFNKRTKICSHFHRQSSIVTFPSVSFILQ